MTCLLTWGCGGEPEVTDSNTDMATDSEPGGSMESDANEAEVVGADSVTEDTSPADPEAEDTAVDEPDGESPAPADVEVEDAAADDTAGSAPAPSDAEASDTAADDTSGDDASSVDAQEQDAGPSEDAAMGDPVSFATVFNEVLEPMGCTAGYCHAGHAGGMLMDSLESAYDNLVNVETSTDTNCDVTMRVVPGDPDASMLWVRVRPQEDDCLTADQKMPPFSETGLTDAQLDLIHDWIATGANL